MINFIKRAIITHKLKKKYIVWEDQWLLFVSPNYSKESEPLVTNRIAWRQTTSSGPLSGWTIDQQARREIRSFVRIPVAVDILTCNESELVNYLISDREGERLFAEQRLKELKN